MICPWDEAKVKWAAVAGQSCSQIKDNVEAHELGLREKGSSDWVRDVRGWWKSTFVARPELLKRG